MPRRGEHHAVRPVGQAGPPGPVPMGRVGVRVVVSTHRGTAHRYRIDPSAFGCSTLVAQLADEWVDYMRVAGLADGCRLAVTIRDFARFVDRACGQAGAAPGGARLDGGSVDLVEVIHGWQRAVRQRQGPRSNMPYQRAVALFTLIARRAARDPGVGERLRAQAASRPLFGKGATTPLDEFSNGERLALRRMARADITALEGRLARGRALLAVGVDPRVGGWDQPANLLWAARHGILTTTALAAHLPSKVGAWPRALRELLPADRGLGHGRYGLMLAVAAALFPTEMDLHPFRVLLLLGMSECTPEELHDLTLADIEFTDGAVRLRQTKARAGHVRVRLHPSTSPQLPARPALDQVHHGTGNWDVAGLLRRLLAVTAMSREAFRGPDWLFLAVEGCDHRTRLGAQVARFTHHGRRFTHWITAHTDPASGSPPVISLPHDARRLRKTAKTTRVAALGGTLSDLAGDDHHVEVFRGHYSHGTTAHVLAAKAVNRAQDKVFARLGNHPILLDADAEDQLAQPQVAAAVGMSVAQAAAMRAGELDMGLTNCRDPYHSPHTPGGGLCHVAPAMCMLCPNAVVFTSHLPRLLLLADHIAAQRDVLQPEQWQAVWGRQSSALAQLFTECADLIGPARQAIEDQHLRLDLPLGMRTEYHR